MTLIRIKTKLIVTHFQNPKKILSIEKNPATGDHGDPDDIILGGHWAGVQSQSLARNRSRYKRPRTLMLITTGMRIAMVVKNVLWSRIRLMPATMIYGDDDNNDVCKYTNGHAH